jgi:phage shock protein A
MEGGAVMAGGRFGRLFKSSIGSLLTPAEDPRAAYADPIQRQRELRAHVRSAIEGVRSTRTRLESQRTAAEAMFPALEQGARNALATGREDLARIALQRRQIMTGAVDQISRQIALIDAELERLALVDHQVSTQLDALAAREQLAEVRRSTAQAQIDVGEVLSGVTGGAPGVPGIEQLERDAESLEARASAIDELLATGVLGDPAWNMSVSAGSDQDIERQLAALKQEMATPSTGAGG